MIEDRACRRCGVSMFAAFLAVLYTLGKSLGTGAAYCGDGMHDFRRCTCKGDGREHDNGCPLEIFDYLVGEEGGGER